jgi:glutathione S-transferase
VQVFGFPLSPFVRKVHVVAAEKGIAIETVVGDPRNPHPDFLAASPFHKIPALKDGDYLLADSTAIVTYLDALRPDPPLLPTEPKERGKAVWWEEFADTILVPAGGKIVFNRFVGPKLMGVSGDEAAALLGEKEIEPVLAYLESAVSAKGWLSGDDYTIGGIAVASTLMTLGYVNMAPDAAKHPTTAAWYARVIARSAWVEVAARENALLEARMASVKT